jgi:hypothetical protein
VRASPRLPTAAACWCFGVAGGLALLGTHDVVDVVILIEELMPDTNNNI